MNDCAHSSDSDDLREMLTAIRFNDIDAAAALIARGVVQGTRTSPLLLASTFGRIEIVAMLLDAGAPIDTVSFPLRQTACHLAIRHGHTQLAEQLIARGANLTLFDVYGYSLVDYAIQRQDLQLVVTLIDAGAPLDVANGKIAKRFFVADIAANNTDLLARMLARNIDLSVIRDGRGLTPLHFLVGSAPEAPLRARMLVHDAKVDVNARSHDGSTALDCAIVRNDVAMLRILAQVGADLDKVNPYGFAPVHIVCVKGAPYVPFVVMLLAVGANFRALTSSGESACRRAAAARSSDILCALIAVGCDLDEPDSDGITLRQVAVRSGCALPTDADLAATLRDVGRAQFDFVRHRALEVCIALQSFELDALQLCEIMQHACRAEFVAFHHWWRIAVAVKHFRRH